jgi:uncharacterized protein (DUF169 family)
MKPLQTDLSVYKKFNFEYSPVGVKFLLSRPEGMEQLDHSTALCEMLGEAQQRGKPFYITRENEDCGGAMVLGMAASSPLPGGGELGVKYGIFEEARVNERLAENLPKIAPGAVKYVAFSLLDRLTFEPDLLFLMTTTSQAEIVLRALSYSTGETWSSKATSVVACSWLFAYPYRSGKVNYVVTGLTFGLKAKKVFPEGRMIFSIPYDWIPVMTRNLEKMEWVLPSYTDETREKFMIRRDNIFKELAREFRDS